MRTSKAQPCATKWYPAHVSGRRKLERSLRSVSGKVEEQVTSDVKEGRFGNLQILITGATGRTGSTIVEKLLEEKAQVRAFVRDENKAKQRFPSVEIFPGDVTKYETLPAAMDGTNAVIIASGAKDFLLNPLQPYLTDFQGTLPPQEKNLRSVGVANCVAAAEKAGVDKLVLVSSIGVDERNPILSLAFWGILLNKKLGEQCVQRSNLDYTIIRPGGLIDRWSDRVKEGNVVMEGAGEFGFGRRKKRAGAILRSQVADCCLEALMEPSAKNKTVEIITRTEAPFRSFPELFSTIK